MALKERNGIVVMLDALGIRQLEIDDSIIFLESIKKLMKDIEEKSKDFINRKNILNSIIAPKLPPFGFPEMVTFGDTVILSWDYEEGQIGEQIHYVGLVEWLSEIVKEGLKRGFLLRGAMTTGKYIKDDNSVLGPAISDAANWYEKAEWIGIITTPSFSIKITLLSEFVKNEKRLKV